MGRDIRIYFPAHRWPNPTETYFVLCRKSGILPSHIFGCTCAVPKEGSLRSAKKRRLDSPSCGDLRHPFGSFRAPGSKLEACKAPSLETFWEQHMQAEEAVLISGRLPFCCHAALSHHSFQEKRIPQAQGRRLSLMTHRRRSDRTLAGARKVAGPQLPSKGGGESHGPC